VLELELLPVERDHGLLDLRLHCRRRRGVGLESALVVPPVNAHGLRRQWLVKGVYQNVVPLGLHVTQRNPILRPLGARQ
jgi:hypothetical protein